MEEEPVEQAEPPKEDLNLQHPIKTNPKTSLTIIANKGKEVEEEIIKQNAPTPKKIFSKQPAARIQNNYSSKKRKVEPEPNIELINVTEDDQP